MNIKQLIAKQLRNDTTQQIDFLCRIPRGTSESEILIELERKFFLNRKQSTSLLNESNLLTNERLAA